MKVWGNKVSGLSKDFNFGNENKREIVMLWREHILNFNIS
jgi:hypothetical protein